MEELGNLSFEIAVGDKTLTAVLRQPMFKEYQIAVMALQSQSGAIDKLAAGNTLVKFCWVEGDIDLKNGDQSKSPSIQKAYATLCLDAYNSLLTLCDSEVKKK